MCRSASDRKEILIIKTERQKDNGRKKRKDIRRYIYIYKVGNTQIFSITQPRKEGGQKIKSEGLKENGRKEKERQKGKIDEARKLQIFSTTVKEGRKYIN